MLKRRGGCPLWGRGGEVICCHSALRAPCAQFAHIVTWAPRQGLEGRLAGKAAAAPAFGRTLTTSIAHAALLTAAWPPRAMLKARLLPPGGPPVLALAKTRLL